MDLSLLKRRSEYEWWIEPFGRMRVPGIIFAAEALVRDMDHKVYEQVVNVATLPGIEKASYAMPDAHWGYGFPIGGVAAFDPDRGGVVSAGGVGFDISCGVRTLHTGLTLKDLQPVKERLADVLFRKIPAGVGSTGKVHLDQQGMNAMLTGGAQWAVSNGFGSADDLERIEEHGCMAGAEPDQVSDHAKKRQQDEMGTLGSGNHYLEVQQVLQVFDQAAAATFRVREGDIVVSIHCGSRGLGHQIGTEFLKRMLSTAPGHGIELPDRELACAPFDSPEGKRYFAAMAAAANYAWANRQMMTHLARQAFERVLAGQVRDWHLTLLYDVAHNIAKVEEHTVDGERVKLCVHRKGATRAFGPGHPAVPQRYRDVGQPVLIPGSMGSASYILVGTEEAMRQTFGSTCHGAGRVKSRHAAKRGVSGQELRQKMEREGIVVRTESLSDLAEEAPEAYKDVDRVVEVVHQAGLARKVARTRPIGVMKG